jgi:hypothetical protein
LLGATALAFWLLGSRGQEAPASALRTLAPEEPAAPPQAALALPQVARADAAPASEAPATASGAPERDLRVRVLDGRDQPVTDVPVELWSERRDTDERGNWLLSMERFEARANAPRGEIVLPAQQLSAAFEKAREARAAGHAASVFLRAESALLACSSHELRDLAVPEDDVELRLEPSGFLRIEVTRPDGAPATHALRVAVMRGVSDPIPPFPRHLSGRPRHRIIEARHARLRVPIAAPLLVDLSADPEAGFLGHRAEIAGPAVEGDEVVLRMALRPAAILTGRLVSAAGEPLVQRELFFTFSSTGGSGAQPTSSTDAQGRFRIALVTDPAPRHLSELRIFPLPAEDSWRNPTELERRPHAVVKERPLDEDDRTELGDLVLAPTDHHLLVTGIVVDPAGAPVPQALAFACAEEQDQVLGDTRTFCADDGRFELYSREPRSRVRIGVNKSGFHLERLIEVDAGARDLRIVLARSAVIEGRVLVPEGFPLEALLVRRSSTGALRASHKLAADGSFCFEDCLRGEHSLSFVLPPLPPLLALEQLEVGSSERCEDPRLPEVDLRELLIALRLRVIDQSSTPLARRTLVLRVSSLEDFAREITTDDAGRCTIPLPAQESWVALALPDGPFTTVSVLPGEHEAQLEEPLSIVLALEPAPTLPPQVELIAHLAPLDPEDARVRSGRLAYRTCFFREGEARWKLATAGRYALRWSASANASPGTAVELTESRPQVLEVQTTRAVQRFVATPPAEALRAALKKLGH